MLKQVCDLTLYHMFPKDIHDITKQSFVGTTWNSQIPCVEIHVNEKKDMCFN